MAKLSGRFGGKTIFLLLFIAVAAIYFWGVLFVDGEFVVPTVLQLEGNVLWLARAFLFGGVFALLWVVGGKLTGSAMTKKDVASLALIIVGAYLVYQYVLVPFHILDATSFREITKAAAMKLGLYP